MTRQMAAVRVGDAFMALRYALRFDTQPAQLEAIQHDLTAATRDYEDAQIAERMAELEGRDVDILADKR
jgi:hypothetical protein